MTTSAATPASAHSRATSGTLSAGTATIARSTVAGHVLDRRRRAPAADEVRVRVDRVELAAEAVVEHVPEGGAAERVRPPRGADHRHRARLEHALDRRHGRDPVAILELAPRVLPQLGRELELDPVGRGAHVDREARLAEDADHAPVLGQHGRGEGRDPARGGDLREVRDQHGGQPAALHLVGDRERDLGPVGPLELEHRVRDDALVGAGGDDQPVALRPVAAGRDSAALSRLTPSEK